MGGIDSGGTGVHRFQLDCGRKLIYASASADGFQGNITRIVDFRPGSSQGSGPLVVSRPMDCRGRKASMARRGSANPPPQPVGKPPLCALVGRGFFHCRYFRSAKTAERQPLRIITPIYSWPTHTALPVGHKILGRDWLLVFDEAVGSATLPLSCGSSISRTRKSPYPWRRSRYRRRRGASLGPDVSAPTSPTSMWAPIIWSTQPGSQGGLRVIDISNPLPAEEVAHYVPSPAKGFHSAQTNDIFVDPKGLIYLIDRNNGLDIVKLTKEGKGR